mgnify:CR=1 FL=1
MAAAPPGTNGDGFGENDAVAVGSGLNTVAATVLGKMTPSPLAPG